MLSELNTAAITGDRETSGKFYAELTNPLKDVLSSVASDRAKTKRMMLELEDTYSVSTTEGLYKLPVYTAVRACSDLIHNFATTVLPRQMEA